MKDFETPIDAQSDFLPFLRIVLKLIYDKREYYDYVVRNLLESRRKFIARGIAEHKG